MKKVIYLFVICFLLVGCGGNGASSNVSMDSIIKDLEDAGAVLESDKPMFSLIGAKDGIIFYRDGKVVKVYEFETQKAIKEAEKAIPAMKDWDKNGLFVLETSDEEAKKVFNSAK